VVASPARSRSGHALLANDPHIGFSKPSTWYEAHIVSPELEVYGHFLSFIPSPILGHTRDIAWAITMSTVDDMDFYREMRNPQDPKQIFVRGKWMPLEERIEILEKWDGRSDVSSNGAALYNQWRSQILRFTLLDEMGEQRFEVFCSTANAWHFYKQLDLQSRVSVVGRRHD
jgi:acyl-homoserine lactone acylase PvdQ